MSDSLMPVIYSSISFEECMYLYALLKATDCELEHIAYYKNASFLPGKGTTELLLRGLVDKGILFFDETHFQQVLAKASTLDDLKNLPRSMVRDMVQSFTQLEINVSRDGVSRIDNDELLRLLLIDIRGFEPGDKKTFLLKLAEFEVLGYLEDEGFLSKFSEKQRGRLMECVATLLDKQTVSNVKGILSMKYKSVQKVNAWKSGNHKISRFIQWVGESGELKLKNFGRHSQLPQSIVSRLFCEDVLGVQEDYFLWNVHEYWREFSRS